MVDLLMRSLLIFLFIVAPIGLILFGFWDLSSSLFDVVRWRGNARLLRTGPFAVATVLHVEQTGTYLNNNPEMRITLSVQCEGSDPFQATTSCVVPLSQVPDIEPGRQVRVAYQKGNPTHVAIVLE